MDFGDFPTSSAANFNQLYSGAIQHQPLNGTQPYDARPKMNGATTQSSFDGISEADIDFLKRMNVNDRDVSADVLKLHEPILLWHYIRIE